MVKQGIGRRSELTSVKRRNLSSILPSAATYREGVKTTDTSSSHLKSHRELKEQYYPLKFPFLFPLSLMSYSHWFKYDPVQVYCLPI